MEIGIVTFRRPDKLRRLVESIRAFYPTIPIAIADNGCESGEGVDVPGCVVHTLPFDCGLSASRNFLIEHTVEDLLILDDDFEFNDRSGIYVLESVLRHDPSIGAACGSAGVTNAMDFGKTGALVPASRPERVVGGVSVQPCDLAGNFMLLRRAMLDEGHRWDPVLKLAEHQDFFRKLSSSKWKVVQVPTVQVWHNRKPDSDGYRQYRQRAPEFREISKLPDNIVVFGVGHSGTRVVVRMLETLGWKLGRAKEGVAENLDVQLLNKRMLEQHQICHCGSDDTFVQGPRLMCRRCNRAERLSPPVEDEELLEALSALPRPWVIKDPRMVLTLDRWKPALMHFAPFLLMVERDYNRMCRTYEKHGFQDLRIYGHPVYDLKNIAEHKFDQWGSHKLRISYESLAEAVGLFDMERVK